MLIFVNAGRHFFSPCVRLPPLIIPRNRDWVSLSHAREENRGCVKSEHCLVFISFKISSEADFELLESFTVKQHTLRTLLEEEAVNKGFIQSSHVIFFPM